MLLWVRAEAAELMELLKHTYRQTSPVKRVKVL
jgi:hypothetical protein